MGGGSNKAQKRAQESAERSYQLQQEQFELEKQMLEEQKRLKEEEELQARLGAEKSTQRKRRGLSSTILTDDSLLNPTVSRKSLYA